MRTGAILLFALVLIVPPVAAQDLSGFEKILLPVYGRTDGASGSSFESRLSMYSESSFQIYPSAAPDAANGISTIAPGFPVTLPQRPGGAPRVLLVKTSDPLFANLSVLSTDATGAFRDQYTPIPVVRETQFRIGRSFIPGVPNVYLYDPPDAVQRRAIPQFRHMLRIYDVDAVGGKAVRVRLFFESIPGLVDSVGGFTVALDRRDGDSPADPWYAQVPVAQVCAPFSQHTPCSNAGPIRYELEPLGSFRYWAMVSTTDNVTHHVSISSF